MNRRRRTGDLLGRPESGQPPLLLVQRKGKKPRKAPAGVATNDLIFTAYQGLNSDAFPKVLGLYAPRGSTVADVTYGKGAFWKNVPKDLFKTLGSDIVQGVDCRALPYEAGSIDCVVLDPPY